MAEQGTRRGDYVLLTFLVTRDGERGHPMDTIVTRIDVDADGAPAAAALKELETRVVREVQGKVRRTRERETDHG